MPGVLALEITGSANFGLFQPGFTKDYTATLAALSGGWAGVDSPACA
jgi:hypothetical protein